MSADEGRRARYNRCRCEPDGPVAVEHHAGCTDKPRRRTAHRGLPGACVSKITSNHRWTPGGIKATAPSSVPVVGLVRHVQHDRHNSRRRPPPAPERGRGLGPQHRLRRTSRPELAQTTGLADVQTTIVDQPPPHRDRYRRVRTSSVPREQDAQREPHLAGATTATSRWCRARPSRVDPPLGTIRARRQMGGSIEPPSREVLRDGRETIVIATSRPGRQRPGPPVRRPRPPAAASWR